MSSGTLISEYKYKPKRKVQQNPEDNTIHYIRQLLSQDGGRRFYFVLLAEKNI